jgi:hypothetical protein
MNKEEIKELGGRSRSISRHLDFTTAGLEGQLELPNAVSPLRPVAQGDAGSSQPQIRRIIVHRCENFCGET